LLDNKQTELQNTLAENTRLVKTIAAQRSDLKAQSDLIELQRL
jgi:hypothetical protein